MFDMMFVTTLSGMRVDIAHLRAHVCSGWYLLWVPLAVFADKWRRGVVVEDRTGEVVDHQHLPL